MSEAHEVGPLGEEAAELFGALSGWAREHAAEVNSGLVGLAEQAAASVHDIDEHLSTGAVECAVCPLCRAIHTVRQVSPEVTGHLASAVTPLAQAAAALMTTADPRGEANGAIEHIPLDDDWSADG